VRGVTQQAILPLTHRGSGARSSTDQRPTWPAAAISSPTRGSQPANSAAKSATWPTADQDSTSPGPAGLNATMFTSRPALTG
jgi:hypothetical protein